MADELEEIKKRYEARNKSDDRYSGFYMEKISNERDSVYKELLSKQFSNFGNLKFLEIGAGNGSNLNFFKSIGFLAENISANELLDERISALKSAHPDISIFPGDASKMELEKTFDVIFQSTVFTSVLDPSLRIEIANNMWRMLKPGGLILWYDFIYNNPSNRDVKKVSVSELQKLFPFAKSIEIRKVTLAPPIARRAGFLYSLFNLFPFLRTHIAASIQKE